MTTMSRTEDTIPRTDAMESHESGKNTVGKNLEEVSVMTSHGRETRLTRLSRSFYKSWKNMQARRFLWTASQL